MSNLDNKKNINHLKKSDIISGTIKNISVVDVQHWANKYLNIGSFTTIVVGSK